MEIIKGLLHLLLINYILFVPPAIVFVAWLVARRLGWLPKKRLHAASALKANRVTCIAEAVILLCMTMAIFVFTATNTSTGGRLLVLDQFQKNFAITNVIVAAVVAIGVLIAVVIVFFRRTFIGVTVAAIVLSCYGLILNGPRQILESLAPEDSAIPDATLTFVLTSPDVEGGELWVNGVHLGTLPYETTFDEFYAKVPFWPQEPNENSRENRDGWFLEPRWNPYSDRPTGSLKRPWARITIPQEPTHWDDRRTRIFGISRTSETIPDPNEMLRIREAEEAEEATRTYYARVKLGDGWGYSTGSSGSSGGGGGRYDSRRASVSFGFIFPERRERIEKLLDIARLCDYSPGPQWFKAMESYRSDGWIAVRKTIDTEPDMSKVFDAWARWKYDLDNVTDSERAWQVFKKICDEAEKSQYYMTSDVTGRAVELLLPKLEPEMLINKALKIIRSTGIYRWILWEMNDRVQFGIGALHTGANGYSSVSTGGNGRRLSPSDYVIVHAIWLFDGMLDSQNDEQPNLIEEKLVPEFICRNFGNVKLLQIAAYIGGPHIERYLLRQNWKAEPDTLPYRQQIGSFFDLNGWLYLLANLQTPVGQQFRRQNADRLMSMADVVVDGMTMSQKDKLDFIFIDKHLGEESLAFKYWPRFKEWVAIKESRDALELQYEYLIRMEPLSTIDMYVQCWKDYSGNESDFDLASDDFRKVDIPLEKRRQIYEALSEQVNRDISNIMSRRNDEHLHRNILLDLKGSILPKSDIEYAHEILSSLKSPNSQYQPENIANWLANTEQTHPLINLLAEADEPELRLLVMGVLSEHPIPANRAIMKKLLQDSDEKVRTAAEEVAAELEELKNTPLNELVSEPKNN